MEYSSSEDALPTASTRTTARVPIPTRWGEQNDPRGFAGDFMRVKDAIREQANEKESQRIHAPKRVKQPPNWSAVHAKEALSQSQHGSRAGPPPKGYTAFPRPASNYNSLQQTSGMGLSQASRTSSVGQMDTLDAHLSNMGVEERSSSVGKGWLPGSHGVPAENRLSSPAASNYGVLPTHGARTALGGSSVSGLNHPSTYFCERRADPSRALPALLSLPLAHSSPSPLLRRDVRLALSIPGGPDGNQPYKSLSEGNFYNAVGNYSMLGSQARSDRLSSAAYGFGTSTRNQMMNT